MSADITSLSYALDTFYFLVSGALVMWMAAGFAMLEAGLVRAKNTAEILTKNVALFAIACVMFMVVGYNVMYPGDNVFNSILPKLGFFLGADNTVDAVNASGGDTYYSNMADFFFQVVFVATAMSIVSGAVAERMRLWSFLLFAVIFTAIIYPVQGYWNWGGGILTAEGSFGYFDYAGSGTVHLAGAVAALIGAKLVGARKEKYDKQGNVTPIPGANLPLATIGMFILWMGWFGFNGGSELKVSNIESANNVALVFVNTNMAAAGGLIAALLTARLLFGKADLTMALNGALAGLVAITASPGTPTPLLATGIGMVGGLIVVFSIVAFDKIKIDDPVGAISVHGVAGIWGILAVLLSNDDASLTGQLAGIALIIAWVAVSSFVVWKLIDAILGLRVSDEDEFNGVDISECGLEAYPEFCN
ncbi:MAG: ammonium transporter [Gammaproteobacteria bacterium]|nr:ammonium transporter [Gammaproteobacteria bacterium]NNC96779.1 ammonium transporter [Gammaproteobacteria bacterium]NNM14964.1 ammonium transporter [Gammaproteobacteria bacterium]